jgi:3-hydroxyacyl-[acyl-carrier-protein] dehydratase
MPPKPLLDPAQLDFNKVVATRDEIYSWNPHRFEFQMLDRLIHLDYTTGLLAGYHDVREDEFWVRGHIPGRPIMPGVLMIESGAQLVSYYAMTATKRHDFLGFAGVDDVRFRGQVVPGQRLLVVGQMLELRPRRCLGTTQAFVNGSMVYEGLITGMWV